MLDCVMLTWPEAQDCNKLISKVKISMLAATCESLVTWSKTELQSAAAKVTSIAYRVGKEPVC
jgi:hypothetical protein